MIKIKQAKSILGIYRSLAYITEIIYMLEQLETLNVSIYQYNLGHYVVEEENDVVE